MKPNNVFVVDDDKTSHFIFKRLLTSCNVSVDPIFFENGLEALEGLKNMLKEGLNLPDKIILDINMPVLDGWQFLEEFKTLKTAIEKEIAVYIVSSSDNDVDRDRANSFKEEIKDYYVKPLTQNCIESIFFL